MQMESKRINIGYISEKHTSIIMRCVKNYGPLPRVDIVEKTGISRATVTRVVNDLIKEGILIESNVTETKRGRHPVNVDICENALYAFGVNISKNNLSIVLVDLKTNILAKKKQSIRGLSLAGELVDYIANTIQLMIKENHVDRDRVLGLGVGVPGLVDSKEGIVKNFALGGKIMGIPLKEILEDRLQMQVTVDNNCNTWLTGERWNGFALDKQDVIFILSSEGVGCGILRKGKICHEINDTAAGFGHVSVDLHGKQCSCGGYGCIETFCSTDVIEDMAEELRHALMTENKAEMTEKKLSYLEIAQMVDKGDFLYASILMEAANAMACGLVSVVNMYSPELIILSGTLFEASDFYYNMVVRELKRRLTAGINCPEIQRRDVSDALFEIGAAATILQELF